ncbi:putative quinol monooxygenase [Paracidovorax sp. MALMAid1276]|uniref:putative quinol monooxygenase n=1 Tax=Paracidovorax sp. MALMAid1276 TaxID=3411631 RepID=UPI003B9D3206
MVIVTVTFHVKPPHLAKFLPAMQANARDSLANEPECHQFDVCVALHEPSHIFLYEVYESAEAFQAHLAMPHFKTFDALTAPWVESKTVQIYERV